MNYDELVKSLRNVADNSHYTSPELLEDAADAIEELDTLLDGLEADNDALCETIEMLKKPRWISVAERLPEPDVLCICWCKGGAYGQIRWYGLYYLTSHRTWAFDDNYYIDNKEVTHWMYPTEPPKEEQTVYDSLKTGLEQAVNGEYRTEVVTKEETE